eukprot:1319726-Prorocentrum_lima.AAC.1
MELSTVLDQVWVATSVPSSEKRCLGRFAIGLVIGSARPEPPDSLQLVQGILDLFEDKLGTKVHPGEAA